MLRTLAVRSAGCAAPPRRPRLPLSLHALFTCRVLARQMCMVALYGEVLAVVESMPEVWCDAVCTGDWDCFEMDWDDDWYYDYEQEEDVPVVRHPSSAASFPSLLRPAHASRGFCAAGGAPPTAAH